MKSRFVILALCVSILCGCASAPPGSDFPKTTSVAFDHPESTRFGQQTKFSVQDHGGNSGFRLLAVGVDGFLTRVQMANAAERTLDLPGNIAQANAPTW